MSDEGWVMPPVCPACHAVPTWWTAESVGPVHLAQIGSDEIEVIPERVFVDCKPCGHKTYESSPGEWALAECQKSEIGLHLWREDWRLIDPVDEYCGACGERRAKTAEAAS